jgi:hypothetical protein
MKQRITYLVQSPENLQPSNIEVTADGVAIKSFDGAKEHHVTLSLAELPREVAFISMGIHHLHILTTG